MTLTQFEKKYPELAHLKITDVFDFHKTILGKRLIIKPRIKECLPEEFKSDLRKVFNL